MFRQPGRSGRGAPILVAALLCASWGRAEVARETSYVYPPFKHTLGMHRVGALEVKLFLGPSAKIENPQGLAATKLSAQDDPKTERDDDELSLFLVNSGRGEIVFNPSQTSLKRFGRRGGDAGEFEAPRGIAADPSGLVAVADTGNHRIALLRLDDKELTWTGEITAADGPFTPTDVAFAAGALWATDHAGDRILRFDPQTGAFRGAWGRSAADSLDGPLALAVVGRRDPWNRSGRFLLAVVDRDGRRLQVLSETGARRGLALTDSLLPGPARFGYPAFDLHGQLLVPDSSGGRLVKFDRRLHVLRVLDHIDDDDRPLQHPNSIALYRRFGQLFIVEALGGTYAWTGTSIDDARLVPAGPGEERGLQLEYFLSEPSLVSVSLATRAGEVELLPEKRVRAGARREWLDLKGMGLRPGRRDQIILRARPTYSARKHLLVERRLRMPAAFGARRSDEGGAP